MIVRVIACTAFMVNGVHAEEIGQPTTTDAMAWLAGEWVGQGRDGEEGEITGNARLYWTPPRQGAVSATFTWTAPQDNHIHYAINIFRDTEKGVEGKGIHYGKDFANFEEAPWEFSAIELTYGVAKFECVANCRAKSVVYKRMPDGRLEARWDPIDDDAADFIVTYKKAGTD